MMADPMPPTPEIVVPVGEGCFDLTTGKPYEPADAAAVTTQPPTPSQPTTQTGATP